MNVIIDDKLRKKYRGLKRSIDDITEITIHGTGGGTAKGIIDWMSSDACERKNNYKKAIGLFSYLIDIDGTIYSIMPDEDWYYHSEAGDYDKHTIGVELVNPKELNAQEYTEAQYQSLLELIQAIDKYPIKIISSHDYNRKKYSNLPPKPCPGKFDWDNFSYMLVDVGFDFLKVNV